MESQLDLPIGYVFQTFCAHTARLRLLSWRMRSETKLGDENDELQVVTMVTVSNGYGCLLRRDEIPSCLGWSRQIRQRGCTEGYVRSGD